MMIFSQRFPHESHRVEVFYDAILTWLTNRSTFETFQHASSEVEGVRMPAEYRTKARSEMSSYFSTMEAIRYFLRKKGFNIDQLKQFKFALRRQFIRACNNNLDIIETTPLGGDTTTPKISSDAVSQVLNLIEGKIITKPDNTLTSFTEGSIIGFYFSAYWVS